MLTDKQRKEIDLYGKSPAGDESDLDKARLARIQYLKGKMRPMLADAIGDYGDNITDVTRALVLGEAIRMGIVKDQAVIDGHKAYITTMLEAYGGGGAILSVMQANVGGLSAYLVNGYYKAKMDILTSWAPDEISAVDLPGEPVAKTGEGAI